MLDDHKYVSGAEEKVLRAFSAPSNFLENLNRISGLKVEIGTRLAQGASTPSLGLSNKAVFEGVEETPQTEKHVKDQFPDNYFTAEVHNEPPPEETLVQNTLWPEVKNCHLKLRLITSLTNYFRSINCMAMDTSFSVWHQVLIVT